MAKKNLIPKSKAKTAYGLLSEIRRLILAEPLRYNQSSFIDRVSEWPDYLVTEHSFPSCGTVGCVAGWVATLKHPGHFYYGDTSAIAAEVLGLTEEQTERLFDGNAAGTGAAQTKRHAKAGAAHITRFQKQHAGQLKAKRV